MAKKRNKHMPVSKAKNAYELLGEIRKLILEEPKRYDQTQWIRHGRPSATIPQCGTVACVAGWVCALKCKRPFKGCTGAIAASILGLNCELEVDLFSGDAAGDEWEVVPQSRSHARAGAAHIKRFMQKHKEQLKSKTV